MTLTPEICFAIAALLAALDLFCFGWASACRFKTFSDDLAAAVMFVAVLGGAFALPLFFTTTPLEIVFYGSAIVLGAVVVAASAAAAIVVLWSASVTSVFAFNAGMAYMRRRHGRHVGLTSSQIIVVRSAISA